MSHRGLVCCQNIQILCFLHPGTDPGYWRQIPWCHCITLSLSISENMKGAAPTQLSGRKAASALCNLSKLHPALHYMRSSSITVLFRYFYIVSLTFIGEVWEVIQMTLIGNKKAKLLFDCDCDSNELVLNSVSWKLWKSYTFITLHGNWQRFDVWVLKLFFDLKKNYELCFCVLSVLSVSSPLQAM